MKCQKCGKFDATTYITEIINGKKSEIFLCPLCAGHTDGTSGYFTSFETDFGSFFPSLWPMPKTASAPAPLRCPNCDTTLSDIQKSGRFGCSDCYTVFFDYIEKPLKEIHGSTKHTGKIPKKLSGDLAAKNCTAKLKEELENAVKTQNFEEAAKIRDRIKELENNHEEV